MRIRRRLLNCFKMGLEFALTPKIAKSYLALVIPLAGFFVGKYLDDQETLRMTRFRDKSALYGRKLAPGEQPSWP
ncbi:hypothetical protein GE061_005293 [Apolygus lucorum]|uniref:Uncharacterized protein n=1 Tax=Apolygus lucorum TaxID=248454 RepID=A0A6A4IS50_APOLU|nr:hypothetical protein GE061_005293 [Apolygus lucorum]